MSTAKVSQELFMKVKEKLDYHKLPAQFPIEATPLLSRLLSIIEAKSTHLHPNQTVEWEGDSVSPALKHEINRLVKQNNELHMNLVVAKEQIQSLGHRIFKLQANGHSNEKEFSKHSEMRAKREQQLIGELQQVKYKYNELMNFLHEDPKADRQYIKRLMKHKKIEISEAEKEEAKEVFKPADGNLDFRVKELESKVVNREKQIQRLHKLIEYDGINMSKLIKNFNEDLTKKQLKNADSKINYLEESYGNIKKENSLMKSKNGSKQALRAEVEKCHQVIEALKKSNQELRRNQKEQEFGIQKRTFENENNMEKTMAHKLNADKELVRKGQALDDLSKKNQFQAKELQLIQGENIALKDELLQLQDNGSKLIKKNQDTRVFYEYEIDALKKRIAELQAEIEEGKEKNIGMAAELKVGQKENELKTESIANLQKIVNQLIRKNSVLADRTAGTLEESLKQSAQLEYKNRFTDLQRQLVSFQNQVMELQSQLQSAKGRLGQILRENNSLKYQNGALKSQINAQEEYSAKAVGELDEVRSLLKKEQADHARAASLITQITNTKDSFISELKMENERLSHQQKALKLRVKDLQIKISEEEGVWEVTRIRLEEKQNKIKQLEKLLGDTIDRCKALSEQVNELDHQNHELSKQKHRLTKKYEEIKKDEDQFKSTSFKNYETAINDNLAQMSAMKKEILRLTQDRESGSIQFQQLTNLTNVIQRQKEILEFEKVSLLRETEMLRTRLGEMQEVERALVLENESLRSLARSL